ncbi:MAG: DoxX family membrane protein [Elusimicrobia bacterium]|nr:DoxX family membrane protein [Elusimicrobiota bacterium]
MKPRALLAMFARVFVGAVLVYAGASKAAAPAEEFALVIGAYDVLPTSMTLPMAGLLPWVELIVGWALILGVQARMAGAAAGAMTTMFLAAIGSVLARGIPIPNCGCFGEAMHFTPGHAFLFDSLLAALCWVVFTAEPDPLSLDSWSDRGL